MISTGKPKHQPTVLLVEDDEMTREAMTLFLVRAGYLVLTAATGHDAIGMIRTPLSPIDVVILDINLPDVSGTDLCARVREIHPSLPIVVCTGQDDAREAARMIQLGVHRYFRKPISPEELLASVEAAMP